MTFGWFVLMQVAISKAGDRIYRGLNSWMAMVVGIRVRSALDIPVHMKPLRRSEAPPDALGVAKKILRTDYQQQRSPTTGGTRR